MHLTKMLIDKTPYKGTGGSRHVLWDDEIPGFGLRIYPSQKKAFILSYRLNRRKRLLTLGWYGVLTLDEARRLAKVKSVEVLQGTDPLAEKSRAREAITFGEFADHYMERHSKPHKRSWSEDWRRLSAHVLPIWKHRSLSSIEPMDAVRLHKEIGLRSIYEANRTVTLLGTMFKLAIQWQMVPPLFANPARGIKKFRERHRDRWITPEELPRLTKAIDEEENIYVRYALWLYLLTGVRKSELLNLRWCDVDLNRAEIRLIDTKSGNDHFVPLSEAAMSFIRDIPRQDSNPFVIVGKKTGRSLVNITKPWFRVRRKAQVEDVRLHDLRRTVGSWLAQSGNSLHLIAKVLNHSSTETTKIYSRFGQNQVRTALQSLGEQVLVTAGKKEPGGLLKLSSSFPSAVRTTLPERKKDGA